MPDSMGARLQAAPAAACTFRPVDTVARHARLPLPGGRAGATVRLHTLVVGERRTKGRFGRVSDWLPVAAYLIEHPGAGTVLVDCGLHPSVAHDPVQNLGRAAARRLEFRMDREQALDEQLRRRGIERDGVGLVLMTHLHPEQVSGTSQFADATFLVDRREWDSAAAGSQARQVDFPFDWRTVDFASSSIDAFATFGRAADVFGDESVRLLATPGHTPGHVSVLVRTEGGREVLICGDAAATRGELAEGSPPLDPPDDEHLYLRSLSELRRFAEQTPSAVVICGREVA